MSTEEQPEINTGKSSDEEPGVGATLKFQAQPEINTGKSTDEETPDKASEQSANEENNNLKYQNNAGSIGQMKEADRLQLNLDRSYQMHRLAGVYFGAQHFWFLFLPPMTLTMISGILAFLVDSGIPLSEKIRSLFSFMVGSIAIVNVFLQNLNNELNFDHRGKSHGALSLGLKQLLNKLSAIQIRRDQTNEDLLKIKELENEADTITKQNDSNLPPPIIIAYDLASTRLNLQLFPPVSFERDNDDAYNRVRWIQIMGTVHNEIFTEFTNSWGWPLILPNAEAVVYRAIRKVKDVLKSEIGEDAQFWKDKSQPATLYALLLNQQKEILRANQKDNGRLNEEDNEKDATENTPLINDATAV